MAILDTLNWRGACATFGALHDDAKKRLEHLNQMLIESTSLETSSAEHPIFGILRTLGEEKKIKLMRTFIGSAFAAEYCCRHPDFFASLLSTPYPTPTDPKSFAKELGVLDLEALSDQLARARHETMVQIIWRDLNRLGITEDITSELSALAETLIQLAAQAIYKALCLQYGVPRSKDGEAQHLFIIGMGKLGAWELNLSSDVDLIFAYPENGQTDGKKSVANETFFTQLGQKLIRILELKQAFRVDMRLRPYGQSGALASSFAALEAYYQTQGRPWERFAMVKSRVIASTDGLQEQSNQRSSKKQELQTLLNDFTYRRYLDYSAIEALRKLKTQIQREVQRKGMDGNIKLGRGGIREIEFIAQSFQVIRGGRDRSLRERRVLLVLPMLEALQYLPIGAAQTLCEAYRFLRNLEHVLQAHKDQQTHQLPDEEVDMQRTAWLMGFTSTDSFLGRLTLHRQQVETHFQAVIAEKTTNEPDKTGVHSGFLNIWQAAQQGTPTHTDDLAELGLNEEAFEQLQAMAASPAMINMDTISRERFDTLMPSLLDMVCKAASPTVTLKRLCPLLRAIARRSAYLVLLIEHPKALEQLVKLSEASPWIADRLTEYPALLDELLDRTSLYSVPERQALSDELRRDTLRLPGEDLESHMEALRYFKNAHDLRVAACEITERLPLMEVSEYLTTLAEVILEQVVQLAWENMVIKHGLPSHIEDGKPDLLIVGYGKLGGIELSHTSDLDLVFIHDADPNQNSVGPRPLDHTTYYTRLGQKIIHIMSTRMGSGRLYEVDMRLRPSGASGPLVSSMRAFEKYQKDTAWTWEHQALVRARVVYGPSRLNARFDNVRHTILRQSRDKTTLRRAVSDMREKMRTHLGTSAKRSNQAVFDLKQDAGGIVDIEFMVQYMVLNWAHSCPALTRYSDNIRILSCTEESGKLPPQEVGQLIAAYKAFRSRGHTLALQQQPIVVHGDALQIERATVIDLWEKLIPKAE